MNPFEPTEVEPTRSKKATSRIWLYWNAIQSGAALAIYASTYLGNSPNAVTSILAALSLLYLPVICGLGAIIQFCQGLSALEQRSNTWVHHFVSVALYCFTMVLLLVFSNLMSHLGYHPFNW